MTANTSMSIWAGNHSPSSKCGHSLSFHYWAHPCSPGTLSWYLLQVSTKHRELAAECEDHKHQLGLQPELTAAQEQTPGLCRHDCLQALNVCTYVYARVCVHSCVYPNVHTCVCLSSSLPVLQCMHSIACKAASSQYMTECTWVRKWIYPAVCV